MLWNSSYWILKSRPNVLILSLLAYTKMGGHTCSRCWITDIILGAIFIERFKNMSYFIQKITLV